MLETDVPDTFVPPDDDVAWINSFVGGDFDAVNDDGDDDD
jgi:hypothetical protein